MKQHAAQELRYAADLLDGDASTILLGQVGVGITDLTGRQLEQAQLVAAQTTHMLLVRYVDGRALPAQGYVRVTDPDTSAVVLYIVDYVQDPRNPRPRVWLEVYAHVTRVNA